MSSDRFRQFHSHNHHPILYFPVFCPNHFFSPKPKSCFEKFFSGFNNDCDPRLFRPFIPFFRLPPPFSASHSSSQIIPLLAKTHNGTFSSVNVLKPLYPHTFCPPHPYIVNSQLYLRPTHPKSQLKHYAYLRYPARYPIFDTRCAEVPEGGRKPPHGVKRSRYSPLTYFNPVQERFPWLHDVFVWKVRIM